MFKKLFYGGTILTVAGLFLLTGSAYAQTADATASDAVVTIAETTATNVDEDIAADLTTDASEATAVSAEDPEEELEGIEVEEVTKMPSRWGIFWRGVKERVSVAVTLDPVKKAEKQLKFAEERMKIAEYVSENSQDSNKQAWAEKAVERANQLMGKVEANKEKWLNHPAARGRKLLENIANHQVRREKIMDKLEEKLPEEKLEKFRELREKGLEGSRRLLNAIANENLPEKARERLQDVKDRIEEHAQEVKEFNEEKRELLKSAAEGDESAREDLKQLRDERLEAVKERVEQRKEILEQRQEKKAVLREEAEAGDTAAAVKLRRMNVVDQTVQAVREEVKERVETRKENRRENILEKKQELREEPKTGDVSAGQAGAPAAAGDSDGQNE
ncbi:MAG: DUF5667 domain-containing protein [Patescibacteria group bacterium]